MVRILSLFLFFLLLEFCTLWLLHFDCCVGVSRTCATVSSLIPKLGLTLKIFKTRIITKGFKKKKMIIQPYAKFGKDTRK